MSGPGHVAPPGPRKRRWFRRGPATIATQMTTICPCCQVAGLTRLAPGQPCGACRSQQAWTELGAAGLVIDHDAIEQAVQARRGEAAGAPAWRRLLAWAPPALTLGVAAVAAWATVALLSARPIGPLDGLIADLRGASRCAALVGLLALVAGVIATVRLRRQRHFRRLPFVIAHAVAVVIGTSAMAIGGLHWLALRSAVSAAYTSMPARTSLGVASQLERIMDATVVVLAPDRDGDGRNPAMGTGAIVAADDHRAWIVTCSHVAMPYAAVGGYRHARAAHPVWVQLSDGRGGRARVRWAAPPPLDLVVVELPIEHPPAPVAISLDAGLPVSAGVTFVPNPYRDGWKVIHGELLRRVPHRTPAGTYDLLYTDLPVIPGDSGSGLFDARGQLIGLNTWTRLRPGGASEGISLPSETMRAVVDAIQRGTLDQLDDALSSPTTRE